MLNSLSKAFVMTVLIDAIWNEMVTWGNDHIGKASIGVMGIDSNTVLWTYFLGTPDSWRAEREKTTGDGWFNMKAPELTEELRNDLKALKMRSAMDPKRFYKKNDREGFPKYFQVRNES